jgi:exopolyphosphatase/guanosine-5'-triphosphate,3'-diphosphate pyrophosphatase
MPLAAIDIGTNTFRLLIAEVHFDRRKKNYMLNEIFSERVVTRLGEGIYNHGFLNKQAISRSIDTLRNFSDTISRYGVNRTSAIATSALRDAQDSNSFLRKAEETTGLEIEIVSGEQEANMTASGMLIDIPVPQTSLMADIGGGSTELIFSKHREPIQVRSLNLGVVYLADKYMKHDPPALEDLKLMGNEISRKILAIADSFKNSFNKQTAFIGTAGTVTALSAIAQNLNHYDHKKIHNSKISRREIENIFSELSGISTRERIKYLPFEPTRLDIIVPGTLILFKLVDIFGFQEITVSNYGLREGILLSLYEKNNEKT